MSRIMFDGIGADAATIKNHYQPGNLVCWYAAGNSYIWTAAEKALFRLEDLVSITLTASFWGADVLDVESGGATPAEVRGWVAGKIAQGYDRPTVYCSLGIVSLVRAAAGSYVLGKDYDIWVADWDGSTVLPYGHVAAKQYRNAGAYDLSVVYDDTWPHRRNPVKPPPPPPPPVTHYKSASIPSRVVQVPSDADHIIVDPFAIVRGKPVALPVWRIPTP